MALFALGYLGAAVGFYFVLVKTAKPEPEFMLAMSAANETAEVIHLADHVQKRAA